MPVLGVVIASVLYSLKGLFAKKLLLHGARIEDVMALRTAWAAPFYLAVLWFQRKHLRGRKSLALMELCGWSFVGFWVAPRLNFAGLGSTSVGLERILVQSASAWIVVLSWVLWKVRGTGRSPVRLMTWIGLGACYAGLAVACLGRDGARATASPSGVFLILSGCLVWALFILRIGRIQESFGPLVTTCTGMLLSAIASIGESALRGHLGTLTAPPSPWMLWLAGLVVLATVIPSFLQQSGLQRLGAVRMGLLSLVGPAVVPLFAAWLLGESMSPPQVAGLLLVLAASVPLALGKT
jgi:drug/metabolite transporter (DMT)-like permease